MSILFSYVRFSDIIWESLMSFGGTATSGMPGGIFRNRLSRRQMIEILKLCVMPF